MTINPAICFYAATRGGRKFLESKNKNHSSFNNEEISNKTCTPKKSRPTSPELSGIFFDIPKVL